jgi:hypothetical protein
MPTSRSDHASRGPRRRRAVRSVVALTLVLTGGCTLGEEPRERHGARTVSGTPSAHDAAKGISRLLGERSAAVRRADPAAYDAGLGGPAAARSLQRRWFDSLVQLPLGTFETELEPATLVRDEDGWWGTVQVTVELAGYDALPVVTRDRYHFRRQGRRYVVTSTTDRAWERRNQVSPQPWDLEAVTVREGHGVLGVFDAASAARADEVVAAVESGVAAMAPRIPLGWDRRVVVYALGSPDFLGTLEGVPGGDPLAVDGLTFPVMAGPDDPVVAGTRFVLNPRLLEVSTGSRDRLVRHELVHVALGSHDDRLPVWLSEGLAEYLSVQTLPPAERLVSGEALAAARAGLVGLPADDTFNGQEALANYGVAWWVCEAIAQTWGEQMLWTLVEELADAGDPHRRLEELLGIPTGRLVRDAGELMLATYGIRGDAGP